MNTEGEKMKRLQKLLFLFVSVFALTGCFDFNGAGGGTGGGYTPSKTNFALGETFTFNEMELTIMSDFMYTVVDNPYSDDYNKKTLGIPVKLKNLKREAGHLNRFFYECYGPTGSELDNVSVYFDDAITVDWGGDILSGVTVTRYFFFLYDGDGSYHLLFDDFNHQIKVNFNIKYVEPTPEPDPELDKPFIYNNLEITFSSQYEVLVYNDGYLVKNYVKMPITLTNKGTSEKHFNFLDYKIYNQSGTEASSMCYYFDEDQSIDRSGPFQPGCSYSNYIYFEYLGNGPYRMDIGLLVVEKTMNFEIQK